MLHTVNCEGTLILVSPLDDSSLSMEVQSQSEPTAPVHQGGWTYFLLHVKPCFMTPIRSAASGL